MNGLLCFGPERPLPVAKGKSGDYRNSGLGDGNETGTIKKNHATVKFRNVREKKWGKGVGQLR